MEEHALRVLEFHRFLQVLKDYASSEVGSALCLSLSPSRERREIEILLRQVEEASAILQEEGDIPLTGVQEVRPLLQRIQAEGTCLLADEFLPLRSTLSAAGRVAQFLDTSRVPHPRLQEWIGKIPEFRSLEAELRTLWVLGGKSWIRRVRNLRDSAKRSPEPATGSATPWKGYGNKKICGGFFRIKS